MKPSAVLALAGLAPALALAPAVTPSADAADHAQLGTAWTRNMVSSATGLPERFDPATGENIVWSAALGTESHSTPVIHRGRILIGTNNGEPRDPRHSGDRGVLFCLDAADGRLLWQLVVPKRVEDQYFDWPKSGMSSTATAEGDRVYIVDNRGVALCLDLAGLANGNDGPFQLEPIYYTPQPTNDLAQGAPAAFTPDGRLKPDAPEPLSAPTGPLDADIVWMFDLSSGAGIWSHDAAHSSVLIRGPHLYLNSGTGVDNTHRKIRRPDAPSLVVLDKATGRYLARDQEGIGPNIFHSTWAPPSMAQMDGRDTIFFAAGNGRVFAFDPLPLETTASETPHRLMARWQFDFDPAAPDTDVHRFVLNKAEGPSNFYGAPVPENGVLYVAGGGDQWWGKNAAWLKAIDLQTDPPRLKWEYPLARHTFSTPAVHGGLVYVTDTQQNLHCVDAATGQGLWVQELKGETWASPLVADGRVYVGTRRGWFHVLAAGRERRTLFEINLGSPISATAVAMDRRLYVTTMNRLFALERRQP